MNIDKVNIKEAREIMNMFHGDPGNPRGIADHMIGKHAIVRTHNVGFYFGTLVARDTKQVLLKNSRWGEVTPNGAFTLSEIATSGLGGDDIKLSVIVPEILLTDAIEVIPCSAVCSTQLLMKFGDIRMNIDKVTIKEAREIMNMFHSDTGNPRGIADHMIGQHVIVRTYSAGVHYGTLVARDTKQALLQNSRRIWKWAGAFTLSEIATSGLDSDDSKLSVIVPEILLTEAIEVIPCSAVCSAQLEGVDAYDPDEQ